MIYTHLAAAVLALAVGFSGAWRVQAWRYDAREAASLEQQREASRAQAMRADKAAESHEVAAQELRTEIKVITREVERVVEKPVYLRECFDYDGMRLLARAVGGPERAASQPAPALPGSDQPR